MNLGTLGSIVDINNNFKSCDEIATEFNSK